jgi:hypothetical protein
MKLETALQYYEAHKADLLKAHRGQVALITGDSLAGIFSSEEEASQSGLTRFGNQPFLVIRLEEDTAPSTVGQQLLRHVGFLAQAGLTDEEIDQWVGEIYQERTGQTPREVDWR